jgi:hypothetical protein
VETDALDFDRALNCKLAGHLRGHALVALRGP